MNLEKVIKQGIAFIENRQQKDGSFLSYSTNNRRSFKYARKYHSTFPSSLILSGLNSLSETDTNDPNNHPTLSRRRPKDANDENFRLLQKVRKKAVNFLLSQKSEHWSFNYWARNSIKAKQMPYPDDLDDTFCALSALYQYNSKLIDGSAMAKIVTLLTAVEEKEGGPYRTWLVPPHAKKVWKDVDLVVNSNVGYFFSLQEIQLNALNYLIESAIDNEDHNSPYYPSEYPVIYFVSRFYKGKKVNKVKKFLISKCDTRGRWNNALYTALSVSSLINFGIASDQLEKSVEYLVNKQNKGPAFRSLGERGWKSYAFCIDPAINRKVYYAGSAALTTAFCLEAICKYQRIRNKESGIRNKESRVKNKKVKKEKDEMRKQIYKNVVKKAEQRFSTLGIDLKRQALKQLEKTLKGDKDRQIVLMPYFFAQAIGKKGSELKRDFLVKLGLANLYGWIAYTIYDDFLDDEGDPKLLSVANVCLRELTTIYSGILPDKPDFVEPFQQVMDKLDAANTWEVTHCRIETLKHKNTRTLKQADLVFTYFHDFLIPDYGDLSQLAHKSLGHALGSVAILFSLGYSDKSAEVKNLMKFFKHYLIARQLNDDAHDWEGDLKMGHINAVGAEILKKLKTQNSKRKATTQSSKLDSTQLFQKIFWYKVVVDVCEEVLKHVQKARGYLKRVSVVSDVVMFEKILVPIEESAKKALWEREETVKFLKTYNGIQENHGLRARG